MMQGILYILLDLINEIELCELKTLYNLRRNILRIAIHITR